MEKEMGNFWRTMKEEMAAQTREITEAVTKNVTESIHETLSTIMEENKNLKLEVKTLHNKIMSMDEQKRKNNIIFFGVEETQRSESPIETIIRLLEKDMHMHISPNEINNAYRLGEKKNNKLRPILVSFITNWRRNEVLKNKKRLRSEIYIKEDLSKETLEKRKLLLPELKEERAKDSHVVNRKLVDVPQFERPIGNHTFHIGKESILSCSVINLGKHKVGWLRAEDQTVLSLNDRVVLSPRYSVNLDTPSTWQLRIRPLRAEDRGCYMCQINTQPSMKWQIGCIDVYVPPDIINEETSADVSAQELDNVTLVCRASGHPPPKITWRREDHEPMLLKKIGSREFYKVDSYTGSSLHLWRVDRRQMGAFLCIAANDVPPAVSKRIILNVNFPPTVIVPNQLLGAPLGTDVVLECTIEAYPNTINYWLKNRGEMLLDGPKYSINEERSSYRAMMKLTIRYFSRSDIGTYNCVSTNSLGKSEGTLRLYEIKLYPSSQSAEVNIGGLTEGVVKRNPVTNNSSYFTRTVDVLVLFLLSVVILY